MATRGPMMPSELPPPNFDPAPREVVDRLRPLMQQLQRYHRHEVFGLEHLPPEGEGTLLAINHSLATYDALLLGAEIVERTGRIPSALGDNLIFMTPWVRRWARRMGIVPASHEHGEELLRRGRLVVVAPGGMREALRPSSERYTVCWENRRGFVKLALRSQKPIVLAACPHADRKLFHVYENRLTKLAYKQFHFPIPLVRGLGPTLLPRPVRLVHLLSEPIQPPSLDQAPFEELVTRWHGELVQAMNDLLDVAYTL